MKRGDREPGLVAAIEAVGSASALARAVGISAPAMVNWTRVPAKRIIEVERITSIPREQLRPDLYRGTKAGAEQLAAEEAAQSYEALTAARQQIANLQRRIGELEAARQSGKKPNGRTPNLTTAEFRHRLEQLDLSQRRFAFMVQMGVQSVNRWATGTVRVPHWERLVLDAQADEQPATKEPTTKRPTTKQPITKGSATNGPAVEDPGLRRAIEAVGTRYALAKALGLTPSSVLRWKRIPYRRLVAVERLTGIDRAILAPKMFEGWERIESNQDLIRSRP